MRQKKVLEALVSKEKREFEVNLMLSMKQSKKKTSKNGKNMIMKEPPLVGLCND